MTLCTQLIWAFEHIWRLTEQTLMLGDIAEWFHINVLLQDVDKYL